jgi:hypothetical protein
MLHEPKSDLMESRETLREIKKYKEITCHAFFPIESSSSPTYSALHRLSARCPVLAKDWAMG